MINTEKEKAEIDLVLTRISALSMSLSRRAKGRIFVHKKSTDLLDAKEMDSKVELADSVLTQYMKLSVAIKRLCELNDIEPDMSKETVEALIKEFANETQPH
jgi:hypothetical protein